MSEDRKDRIWARAHDVEAAGGTISKAALAREFGVSRQTVTKALERCVTCGRPSQPFDRHCGYHVPRFECREPFCRKVVHQKGAACSDHSEQASQMTAPIVEVEFESGVRIGRVVSASFIPGEEVRSHFVTSRVGGVASDTEPCKAPEGFRWVWARSRRRSADPDPLAVGKWLIYVTCAQVSYCWGRVREATEEGALGIGAKVSTDWGKARDPAGYGPEGSPGWADHVICIYTADWRDRDDVARVGRGLGEIDAVRKQRLTYKPDAFSWAGMYSGNAPGEVAIYGMRPPYSELHEYAENLGKLRRLIEDAQT